MTTNAIDQAFPMPGSTVNTCSFGLTKREYFAAMAMQGLCANSRVGGNKSTMTLASVMMADTLIAALNEVNP